MHQHQRYFDVEQNKHYLILTNISTVPILKLFSARPHRWDVLDLINSIMLIILPLWKICPKFMFDCRKAVLSNNIEGLSGRVLSIFFSSLRWIVLYICMGKTDWSGCSKNVSHFTFRTSCVIVGQQSFIINTLNTTHTHTHILVTVCLAIKQNINL